jgi:Family of unknown function (DUF5522)
MTKEDRAEANPIPVGAGDSSDTELKEGVDYYVENGLFVFTAAFLLKRGYCCESGCRHCPYGYMKQTPARS